VIAPAVRWREADPFAVAIVSAPDPAEETASAICTGAGMAVGSWRRRIAQALLLRADGTPRPGSWRLLFDANGRMIWPLRRLFFRSSGAARPDLGEDLAGLIEAPRLAAWLGRHDGPEPGGPPPLPLFLAQAAGQDSSPDAWEPVAAPGAMGPAGPDAPIALLLPGATLRQGALERLADALAEAPDADLVYGDEVTQGPMALPVRSWFKPRYSPALAQAGVLFGRLVGLSARAAARLDRSVPPDEALVRLAETLPSGSVRHLPRVLSVTTGAATPARPVAAPPLPDPLPRVSVLIPTRDRWSLLGPCLASLHETDWPAERLEIIVIDNGSSEPETLAQLALAADSGRIRVLRDDRPFNFARLNNLAAGQATGELLVFLNNDTVALTPDWLRRMAAWAMQPDVGAVGPKLLYPDGRVQHGGMILGIAGRADHAHISLPASAPGYAGLAGLVHEVSAVTGACLALRRDAFNAVGGFDETFAVAFNDVVLCADLLAAGYRNLYLPQALFRHHESPSRGRTRTPEDAAREQAEADAARLRHAALFAEDPYYSPSLSDVSPYALADPPRPRRLR
jgi:GT2 family glycosyltransferase